MQRSARRKRGEDHQTTGAVYVLPYRRVSGREQEREGLSLDAQQTDLDAVTERFGWVLGTDKEGGFVDVMKGRRVDREDYQNLLGTARRLVAEGKDVVVLVKWLDRLGRQLLEFVRAREELKALGVRVYSVMEGGFISDLQANILATVAQHEVERLGDRVAEAWDEPFENGWHFVGRMQFGYQLRPRTEEERATGAPKKVHDVDPVAHPHVVRAFERAAAGEPIQHIARDLAALPEAVRGKRALSNGAVRWMLSNPVYVARPLPEGEATPEEILALPCGRWPALVPDDLWLAVQRRAETRRRVSPTRRASDRYLLTGFLRCPTCGERMTGNSAATGPRAKYGRYTCSGKMLGANARKAGCATTATMAAVDARLRERLLPLLDLGDAERDVLRAAGPPLGAPGAAGRRRGEEAPGPGRAAPERAGSAAHERHPAADRRRAERGGLPRGGGGHRA